MCLVKIFNSQKTCHTVLVYIKYTYTPYFTKIGPTNYLLVYKNDPFVPASLAQLLFRMQ